MRKKTVYSSAIVRERDGTGLVTWGIDALLCMFTWEPIKKWEFSKQVRVWLHYVLLVCWFMCLYDRFYTWWEASELWTLDTIPTLPSSHVAMANKTTQTHTLCVCVCVCVYVSGRSQVVSRDQIVRSSHVSFQIYFLFFLLNSIFYGFCRHFFVGGKIKKMLWMHFCLIIVPTSFFFS